MEKINKMSESYIASEMNYLIEDPKMYSGKIMNSDHPILTIIKQCFSEYNDGKVYGSTIGTIADVYCYQNELKWSITKYDLWPEYFKTFYVESHGKIIPFTELDELKKRVAEDVQNMKNRNLEMVNYIASRHKEKLI
jgi:hypothetical protein